MRTPKNPGDSASSNDAALVAAMTAAQEAPEEAGSWDRVEQIAAELDQPEEAVRLYAEVLRDELPAELVAQLGERAAKFHDEWFSVESPHLTGVLRRVFEVDGGADWAFQRLTHSLTVAEKWGDLLALYDSALERVASKNRRGALLEEAADIAKDFAGDSDRAIGYLQELRRLKPRNSKVASTLERLLDRHEHWRALIELWTDRLAVVTGKQQASLREQIAACYLEKLGEPAQSLAAIEELLEAGADDTEACRLLEAIVRGAATPAETRHRALEVLRARYEIANRERDVVDVIEAAIELSDETHARQLREQAGHILATLGESTGSFDHFAAVLEQDPSDVLAQEELRHLARQSAALDRYARVLETAADRASDPARVMALRVEAAQLHRDQLGDADAAVAAYRRAFQVEGAAAAAMGGVCRALDALYASSGRDAERLDVLERLAGVEERAGQRRRVLGDLALLAEKLGELDRAVTIWKRCLEADSSDVDAISALVRVHEARESWSAVCDALRRRVDAPVAPFQRRADLVRIAELSVDRLGDSDRAIASWRELHSSFGTTSASVDALAGLLAAAERWEEYATLLEETLARDIGIDAERLARVGDVCREHLANPARAVAAYRSALAVDAAHAASRAGMTALLDEPEARDAALESLALLYQRTGEWEQELGLVDARLAAVADDAARVGVLRAAAATVERRGHDAERALGYVARALALAPDDVGLAEEVMRLGSAAQAWTAVRDALRAAAEVASGDTVAALRLREAQVCERRLDDAAAALEAYRAVSALRPADLELRRILARLAFGRADWATAAESAVVVAAKEPVFVGEAIALFDDVFGDDLAALVAALAEALQAHPALPGPIASRFEVAIGGWLRDRLSDSAGALAAFERAASHTPADREVLSRLAELQRGTSDAALFATLKQLASTSDDDLDSLTEAAELAAGALGDPALARATYQALLDRARSLWRRGAPAAGARQPEATALAALDGLVAACEQAGDTRGALVLVVDATTWPVDADRRNAWRMRAAELAAHLGEPKRAIALLRDVLDERSEDTAAMARLAELYAETDDIDGLVTVRRRELASSDDAARRLELRLDLARLAGEIEVRSRRVETLLENLDEEPGHQPSLDALSAVLRERAKTKELADVFARQARAVKERGNVPRATALWLTTAQICERELAEVPRALESYGRAVDLTPESVIALDGLARLNAARGAHGEAIDWLGRLLECAPEDERTAVRLRLARSLVEAGRLEDAVTRLEDAGEVRASESTVRNLLADLYRRSEAWEPLARLMTMSLPHIEEADEALATARLAAELFREKLDAPERAILALRRAIALSPDDLELRKQLAEGLRLAGQYADARETLEGMIREFGRRRSPERADAHYELALVARAQGETEEALAQLEEATGMAVGNTGMLRALAELARETEQHERAERAYRGLLLAVRRREGDEDERAIGESEVLFELHYLAADAGDEERAEELRESAVEAAVESDLEVRRARRTLLAHDDHAALVEVVEQRLEEAVDEAVRAQLLGYLAEAHAAQDHDEEALDAALDALRGAPDREELHDIARKVARKRGDIASYVDVLRDIASRSRRKEDSERFWMLQMMLGETLERDSEDLAGATEAYRRAAETGVRVAEALSALARVAGARGDTATQSQALDQLLEMAGDAPPAQRADALYQIAEIRAADADTHDDALHKLEAALAADPRFGRAAKIARMALDRVPGSSAALALYERVARRTNDREVLLDYFERSAGAEDIAVDDLREGVELAMAHGAPQRAQALLDVAMQRARQSAGGLADHAWVPLAMIGVKTSAGDYAGGRDVLIEITHSMGADPVWDAGTQLAELARAAGDTAVARDVLAELRQYRPDAREVWEPLFQLYRQTGDLASLDDLSRATVPALMSVADRNELRMMHAAALEQADDGQRPAFELYRDVLLDEPGHLGASARLEALLEVIGTPAEIVSFVTQQFDDARERGDAEAAAVLALRLRDRLADSDPGEALAVLRSALELAPENADLLRAVIGALDEYEDALPWKRRLLAVAEGQEAESLALDVFAASNEADDADGALDALERGYRAAPWSAAVRERLETNYRERGAVRELAGYLRSEAQRVADAEASATMLGEVAAIHRDMLFDVDGAMEALRLGAELAPQNMTVLGELVRTLESQNDHAGAIDELERALERGIDSEAARVDVLAMLSDARMRAGDLAGAVAALEAAHELDAARVSEALGMTLTMMRDDARDRDDRGAERVATLKLARRALAAEDDEECRAVLEGWLARDPSDVEVLDMLRELHTSAERWDEVVVVCARLVYLEEGDEQLTAAHRLAEAAARVADSSRARPALEEARSAHPDDAVLVRALRSIYEQTGAHRELAELVVGDAQATDDPGMKVALLLRATDLLLRTETPTDALPVLEQAKNLQPDDPAVALRWIDTLIATGRHDEAKAELEAMTSGRVAGKSTAPILVRLARLEQASGDPEGALKTLEKAFNANRDDGELAAELARAATQMRQLPLAIKALRTISLKKLEGPVTPEEALIEEGRIELMRANKAKATMLAKKVLRDNPASVAAQELLDAASK